MCISGGHGTRHVQRGIIGSVVCSGAWGRALSEGASGSGVAQEAMLGQPGDYFFFFQSSLFLFLFFPCPPFTSCSLFSFQSFLSSSAFVSPLYSSFLYTFCLLFLVCHLPCVREGVNIAGLRPLSLKAVLTRYPWLVPGSILEVRGCLTYLGH